MTDFYDTNYNIKKAENGYIVNRTEEVDAENKDTFSSSYTSETFVFQNWNDVLDWLKNAEASQG